jgi:AmmeMemoRadiSam system protein B
MALDVRRSPIAGTWYEADPKTLKREVDGFMDAAHLPALAGEVLGIVAPHAGYYYSGPVAGYAFAALRGAKPDLVAVLAPYHQFHHSRLLIADHNGYETPLGTVQISQEALGELEGKLSSVNGPEISRISNDQEHSLEIQLPFLQQALASEWELLPLMVSTHDAKTCRAVAKALAEVLRNRRALLVASTDLSHYNEQQVALTLDRALLAKVEAYETETLFDLEKSGRGSACGLGALATVMWAAQDLGANKIEILRHATSGDMRGDFSKVVGYGAAAIMRMN